MPQWTERERLELLERARTLCQAPLFDREGESRRAEAEICAEHERAMAILGERQREQRGELRGRARDERERAVWIRSLRRRARL